MKKTLKAALIALTFVLAPILSHAGFASATAEYPITSDPIIFSSATCFATSGTYYQINLSGNGRARIYGPNNLYIISTSNLTGWGASGSYYMSAEATTPGSYAFVSVTW